MKTKNMGVVKEIKSDNGKFFPRPPMDIIEEDDSENVLSLITECQGTLDYFIRDQIRLNY